MLLASLPMYDLPELRPTTEAWWAALAGMLRDAGLADVPTRLRRMRPFGTEWRHPELLFSQCCGFDFVRDGGEFLQVIATPVYAVPGCDGPYYRSFIVVREDDAAQQLIDLRGRTCAVNSPGSHSGYNVLRAMLAPLAKGGPFFRDVITSGGHAESLSAVQERRADIAAVDCVSHALLARYRPSAVAGLRILAQSPCAPALPYVTQRTIDSAYAVSLRTGLQALCTDPAYQALRRALFIGGVVALPDRAYTVIGDMQARARDLGYAAIA